MEYLKKNTIAFRVFPIILPIVSKTYIHINPMDPSTF